MTPKSPSAPPGPLTYEDRDLRSYDGPLLRIHATSGRHASRWDAMRTWGPTTARWDPHPPPPREHPGVGVLYSATDPSTPFGEVFQDSWVIDLHEDGRHLSGWRPTRGLMLLDLIDTWPLRNGATYDLSTSERHVCRRWAQAIHDQLSVTGPGIDGLWAPSTMTGRAIVVLFGRAADSFPSAPDLSRPLHHDDLVAVVEQARLDTGYDVVG